MSSEIVVGIGNEKLSSEEVLKLRELLKLLPRLRQVVADYEAGDLNNTIKTMLVIDGRIIMCNGNRSKFSDPLEEEKYNGMVNAEGTTAPAASTGEGKGTRGGATPPLP